MPDINAFYDDSFEILALNERLLTMAADHPQGVKSLLGGRVVILRDGVHHLLFAHSAILNICQSILGGTPRQYC
jgi:antiviral helicase SKI2